MSISIKKVDKFYKNKQALNDVSFSLEEGEIVGFLGPNGAGKTTLMKIICAYIEQDSGTVSVCDIDTKTNKLLAKDKIGYLSESNPLYLDMYVKEYLYFIGNICKVKNLTNLITKIIYKTGLESEKHKKIVELSKGFKQRVGLAAALINNPKILILDEPTTGLDPNQLVEIRRLIKEVARDKTVLISTHIMQEVEKICTRVIIINHGKVIDDQLISNLKKNNIDLEIHFRKLTS